MIIGNIIFKMCLSVLWVFFTAEEIKDDQVETPRGTDVR